MFLLFVNSILSRVAKLIYVLLVPDINLNFDDDEVEKHAQCNHLQLC